MCYESTKYSFIYTLCGLFMDIQLIKTASLGETIHNDSTIECYNFLVRLVLGGIGEGQADRPWQWRLPRRTANQT